MSRETFLLARPAAPALAGWIDRPEGRGPFPTAVCVHGFKGFCEWGFWPPFADLLAARGCAVVRFNFSGSGMRLGEERVSDLEAFRRDTYITERDELLELLERLDELRPGAFDRERLALVGHSRGGAVALLAAAHAAWRERLSALVTWNAIGHCDRWSEAAKTAWRARGDLPVENLRSGQLLALGTAVLDELETHAEELDLAAAAGRRRAAWLIVHGTADEAVPVVEADELARTAAEPFELLRVADGSHTFGAQHPFAGPTRPLVEAFNASQRWILRHLER